MKMRMPQPLKTHTNGGFTFVELVIVTVMVSLIVAAIMASGNMIRNAQLQSVVTDINEFTLAMRNFENRYGFMPGDLPDAEDYWGAVTTDNGDGDGILDDVEILQFWQQLSLAGFLEGNYLNVYGGAGTDYVVGENCPESGIESAGFQPRYFLDLHDDATHAFLFGGTAVSILNAPVLTPTEAHGLDQKYDDGFASQGDIRAGTGTGFVVGDCTDELATDPAAAYDLTQTDNACLLYFRFQSGLEQ